MEIEPNMIRRILVRQVNWVGDAILTLPALDALDRRFPEAEIVLLAKPWVAGLFAGHPAVDRLIEYRAEDGHGGLLGRWRLSRRIAAERFDLAVLFPNSFDAATVPWLAGIPRRVGYRGDGRRLLLTHPVPRRPARRGRHQVENYLDLVRVVGGEGRPVPILHITHHVESATTRFLKEYSIEESDILVAVNPGSVYGGAKRWPAERFAAAADGLAEKWGARILLVGSGRETPILDEVAARMQRPAVVLGGRTDLSTLAGLLRRSRLLLSNDTGAMHIAAAVGTPVVAVFGPTDAVATGPLGCQSRVVQEPVACSPCLLRECPIDHRCMTHLPVGRVLEAANELLEAAQGSGAWNGEGRVRTTGVGETPGTGTPAAFLDRDGTIIEDSGYLGDPEGIQFIPGALDALRALRDAGFRLILLTNQAGVARGLISEADVRRVNERLRAILMEAGVALDAMYYCPHHPDYGPSEYRRECECRKPNPGMIHRALRDFPLDPARSVVIGDHLSDPALAQAFPGMRGILLLTGHGRDQLPKIEKDLVPPPAHVAPDLRAAVEWFLAHREQRDGRGSPPA